MKSIINILMLCMFIFASSQTENIRPNFVILFTDDQRIDTFGAYNDECPILTPNLDQLASQGIKFINGFVTTPICVVSRASLLTGKYGTNNRVYQFNEVMQDDVFNQSYPVLLRQAGYFVGNYGKYGVGISENQKKQFDLFEGQSSQGSTFRNYKGKMLHDAEWLTAKANDFLETVPEEKPFCLQLNYKEPHS